MTFQTFGPTEPGSMTATEYAQSLIDTWDGGTGYMDITWPA